MIKLDTCPICLSDKQTQFIIAKDHLLSQESFGIVECKNCGFKFTSPRPSDSDLAKYYKSTEYISHTNSSKGIVSKLYQIIRRKALKDKEAYLSSNVSRGTLLDYGCGTGHFLAYCKSQGWLTKGIEPDSDARKIANGLGLNVYQNKENFSEVNAKGEFDAITLWHVLEHVTDLQQTLVFLNQHLKEKGNIFVAVPNHQSYDANHYGKFWAAYDVPRHLYHFDKNSITSLLEKNGFKLAEIKPMYFDSFYVSMLSEKNRSGTVNYIRAFLIGLISNLKAARSKNYSSLIYRFTKEV